MSFPVGKVYSIIRATNNSGELYYSALISEEEHGG